MTAQQDERFMRLALRLANQGMGLTSPNPPVGCVIVKDGKVIGAGYHQRAGLAHAEIVAMGHVAERKRAASLRGATMYVTLEPCCIFGRTPPCTDAIVAAGIGRVVAGTIDPNPSVNGRGIRQLRKAGIDVTVGVLEEKCREIIKPYAKFIVTGRPYVTVKFAQSLDGRLATITGSSQWISSAESMRFAHRLRAHHDAVLVGAGTANIDNPRLTVRHVKGRNPLRIVLTQSGRLRKNLHLFSDAAAPTIVATGRRTVVSAEAEILRLPARGRQLDLEALLAQLGAKGVVSLLVEGGSKVITSFLRQRQVDRVIMVVAPIIIGAGLDAIGDLEVRTIDEALRLNNIRLRKLGPDCMVIGEL